MQDMDVWTVEEEAAWRILNRKRMKLYRDKTRVRRYGPKPKREREGYNKT